MARTTLISTVGTSLFDGNLKALTEKTTWAPANRQVLHESWIQQDWDALVRHLSDVDPRLRVCGAEINSIEEVRHGERVQLEHLVFMVSDTAKGRDTGRVLQKYFEARTDLRLRKFEYQVVDDLQDERPADFRTHGLRNLVRHIGATVQAVGGPDFVAIDATGGYKAQIAIAVLVGQAMDIPVYYKHEFFNQVIDFPPMPIAFDYDLLGRNADILTALEKNQTFTSDELFDVDDKLRVFLIEVPVDHAVLYELSPVGQIYLQGFRVRFPRVARLIPSAHRREPSFRDDHYPIGFREFVHKVWAETPWISTTNSLPYRDQRAIKGIGFNVRESDGKPRLVGTYQDRDSFGGRFRIHLDDEARDTLAAAALELNQRYGDLRS
ncbi:MAG: putative CRISPR-associated protein [Dehalococcoidia bacterium]